MDLDERIKIAQAMRAMPEAERDGAIRSSPNVIDLRADLNFRRRQRAIAAQYRAAFRGRGPVA